MIGYAPNPLRETYDQIVIARSIAADSAEAQDWERRSNQLVNCVTALGEARCHARLGTFDRLADDIQATLQAVVEIIRRNNSLDYLGSAAAVQKIGQLATSIWNSLAPNPAPTELRAVYDYLVSARHIVGTARLVDCWKRREVTLKKAGEQIDLAFTVAESGGITHLSERVEALLIDLVDRTRKGPDLGEADIECAGHEIGRLIAQVWSTVDQITPKPVLWGKEATR